MFANPRLIPRSFTGPLTDLGIQSGTERLPRVYKHPPPSPFFSTSSKDGFIKQSSEEDDIKDMGNVVLAPWTTTLGTLGMSSSHL